MVKLTKAIIKKYGISKKAWAVARRKTTKRSKSVKRSPVRRRKTRTKVRRMAKRKSSMLTPEIKGIIGAVVYDSLLSPMIPLEENTKNLVELGAGFFMRKKTGWLGATAKTLLVLNGYQLLRSLIGDKLGGVINPSGGY